MVDKKGIGSNLRSLIEYYTELTVEEHLMQNVNDEADSVWNKITTLINKLVEN